MVEVYFDKGHKAGCDWPVLCFMRVTKRGAQNPFTHEEFTSNRNMPNGVRHTIML